MAKTKKQIKIEQANMQTDALTSDGIQWSGDQSENFTYSFADLDKDFDVGTSYSVDGMTFDSDDKSLKEKYPALQDAWDHYQNVKHMCEQKEKEENDQS
tara:strand:- start:197 stop:493 length:297 start_codon:yes stop_codon:yes gene_type:complete